MTMADKIKLSTERMIEAVENCIREGACWDGDKVANAIIARLKDADRYERGVLAQGAVIDEYKKLLIQYAFRWQALWEWAEGADYPGGYSVTHEYDQQSILAKLNELEKEKP
jgi:hypothetical protein